MKFPKYPPWWVWVLCGVCVWLAVASAVVPEQSPLGQEPNLAPLSGAVNSWDDAWYATFHLIIVPAVR